MPQTITISPRAEEQRQYAKPGDILCLRTDTENVEAVYYIAEKYMSHEILVWFNPHSNTSHEMAAEYVITSWKILPPGTRLVIEV